MAKRRRAATRDDTSAPKRVSGSTPRRGGAKQLALPLDAVQTRGDAILDAAPILTPIRAADTLPALVAAHSLVAKEASASVSPAPIPERARPSGPREGRGNMQAHFAELRAALEDGWEIVQPIFARPMWTVVDDSATELHFVLRRDVATRLVTVPEGRGVQRFIREHHLAVNYLAS